MKAHILCLTFIFALQSSPDRKVFICDSPNAKKYHLKNDCRGLNRCTHKIIEVKEESAKKKGFELCKLEK